MRSSALAVMLALGILSGGLDAPAASEQEIVAPRGPLLFIGGRHQDLANDIREVFFDLAGGRKAKIVVIPTAIAGADEPGAMDEFLKPWQALKPLSVLMFHTRDRKLADDAAFVKPLTEATAVFFTNGHRDRIFKAYRATLVEKELKKLHARGGLIGGTGTGAAVQGDLVIDRASGRGLTEPGLGLLPGFLIEDRREHERLAEALAANPANVGLSIDGDAAVVIRGKNLRVLGKGTVTVRLAKGSGQEAKIDTLKAGAELDLIELRRAAAKRADKKTAEPLKSNYEIGKRLLPHLYEYRVTGNSPGKTGSLTFTYFYQPVVVIYCRQIDASVIRLLKKIDAETAKYRTKPLPRYPERLASYLVLVCDTQEREKDLKALAEREKIEHTTLAMMVINETTLADKAPQGGATRRALQAKLGEAETTVLLTEPRGMVKAAYAYRKGELNDKEIERIFMDLPMILPKKSNADSEVRPSTP